MSLTGRYMILFFPVIISFGYMVSAKETREEAIFGFSYARYSSDFLVYIDGDSVYVPLQEALSFFKIYYTVKENQRYEGYVNNKDSAFVLDFKTKEIVDISGNKSILNDDKWFATDLQIFVLTDLLADIFKLKFRTEFNSLSINVQSPYQLPMLRAINVDQRRNNFAFKENEEIMFPMISDRKFTFLNGGILDYTLGTTQSSANSSYNFSGNLGMEVLGGEFQYSVNGRSYGDKTNYDNRVRWRYLINSDWIQSISVGDIQNMSYRNTGGRGYRKPTYQLLGAQISNETQKMPNVFTNYIIEDRIEPDWNVELYLADQLYDVKKADINGYYRFEIPVTYGLTNMKVKIYGNKGEFITTEKVLNIPSQLLVPGEIRYTLSAGQDEMSKRKLIDGSVFVGITPWLTTSISSTKDDATKAISIVNQTSVNLFNNFLLNLTATNDGIYEAAFKLPNSIIGNLDVSYTVFNQENRGSNPLSTLNVMTSINRLFKLPFTLSLYGARNQLANSNTTNLNSNLNFYIKGVNFSLRHNLFVSDAGGVFGDITQSLSTNVSYSINKIPDFLSFIKRISLNASTNVDVKDWQFSSINAGMQMQIARDISLTANYNYSPIMNSSSMRIGWNMNMPAFRNNTNADLNQGRGAVYSTDMSGSLEFDSKNLRLSFLNSMGSSGINGKSSAAIRFYKDLNYNNIFDKGDELIPEADFSVLGSSAQKSNAGKYKIISNLVPNTRYNIQVKTESFPNQATIPKITEFSFIAEPYSYKSIDIACHISGFIEGSVYKKTGSGKQGFGGMRIHIISKDSIYKTSILVFSDGSYFINGIPVGDYTAYVDSSQLRILGCVSAPVISEFKIKPSLEGDYVGNLNFILSDNDSVAKFKKENTELIAKQQPKKSDMNGLKNSSLTGPPAGNAPSNSSTIIDSLAKPIEVDSTAKPIGVNSTTDTTSAQAKYKIQLLASRKQIKVNDQFAKLLANKPELTIEEHKGNDGWYRYSAGAFMNVDEANESMKTIKESGWKRCFVAKEKTK